MLCTAGMTDATSVFLIILPCALRSCFAYNPTYSTFHGFTDTHVPSQLAPLKQGSSGIDSSASSFPP